MNVECKRSLAAALVASACALAVAEPTTTIEVGGEYGLAWKLPAYEWDYGSEARSPELRGLARLRVESGDLTLANEARAELRPSASGGPAALDLGYGENALYWAPGDLRLGFGWQYFAWGTADGQNPTDRLNARDYRVGLEARKIPALALSATWYFADSASLQLVAKPMAEAGLFPADFRAEAQSGIDAFNASFNALIPGAAASGSAAAIEPAAAPESAIAGGRLSFATAAADISVSYLYDWDEYYAPEFGFGSYAGRYYPSSVALERRRVHRLGADLKAIAGSAGLWAEAAFGWPEGYSSGSYSLRRPSVDWTAGADLSFGPSDSFYLNLQYLGRYALDFDRSFSSDYPGGSPAPARLTDEAYMRTYFERAMVQKLAGQGEGLLQGLSLNLKLPLPDAPVVPSLTALCLVPFLYDDAGGGRYLSLALKPEIDIAPADSFHIVVGAELCYAWIEGPDGAPRLDTESDRLGIKTKDNNVYASVRYSWNYRTSK
jgi:hypothetical protein